MATSPQAVKHRQSPMPISHYRHMVADLTLLHSLLPLSSSLPMASWPRSTSISIYIYIFLGSVRLNVSLCLWFWSKICVWFVILKGKIIDLTFVFRISMFMFVIVFGFVFVFVILAWKIINQSSCFWFWAWLGMRGWGPRKPDGVGLGLRKKPV